MTRRVLPLLLVALVIAGVTAETCAQGRCPSMSAMPAGAPRAARDTMHHEMHAGEHAGMHAVAHATSHDCCDREGLTRPPCCPTIQLGADQSSPAAARASDVVQLAATQPAPFVLVAPALVRRDTPRRFDPGAPPGTLIAQHTSLLV